MKSHWELVGHVRVRCFLLSLLCVLPLSYPVAYAQQSDDLAVIYPNVREPFAGVYRDFVTGIKRGYSGPISEYPINGDANRKLIEDDARDLFSAYITLGNKSLEALLSLKVESPVLGAVTSPDVVNKLYAGVLLKPSANVYLGRLLDIYPKVPKIHVVYNPKKQNTLIEEALDFLDQHAVTLDAVPATNLREAALGYRKIISRSGDGDAVWLISDPVLIDSSLLGLILDAAWKKRLAVFSSNPLFVKRGALFAIYPDNVGIGFRLGNMAMQVKDGTLERGEVQYLKDVKIAFNERTSDHIGIKLSPEARQDIEMILPEL